MMWCFCRFVTVLYLCGAIEIDETDSINRRYQIMVVNLLKNWSSINFSHYIIKFVGFISIYYAINLIIVLSFMVFKNLYTGFIDLLQV